MFMVRHDKDQARAGLTVRWIDRLIRRYQESGGSRRWFGIRCNFEPTCSEYTRQAINRFGLCSGLGLGMQRIRRCRCPDPADTILDPLPEKEEHSEQC